ncbi:MAG: hypothetical protein Q8K52_05845 [Thiobacillus sp.]|nr:hypothetical protein [Thiobacillus sp.]
MKLIFPGATREVTGSSYLVDCGVFEAGRDTRAKNPWYLHSIRRRPTLFLLIHTQSAIQACCRGG